jgi:hypothetical protein
MAVQLYAKSTDSLCSFASLAVLRLGLTGFSNFTTAQGVHCVGKDIIPQMGGNSVMERVSGRGDGKLARTANLTTNIAGEEIEPADWLLQLGRPVVS